MSEYGSASNFFISNQQEANSYYNYISNLKLKDFTDISNQQWAFRNAYIDDMGNINKNTANVPFNKYLWKDWIKTIKNIYTKVDNVKYEELQTSSNDGYKENEVDIIVPNTKKVVDSSTNESMCSVTDEFKKVWIDSILGIFSVASSNCSNNKDIMNNSLINKTYGCDPNSYCCCNEDFSSQVAKALVDKFNYKYNKNIEAYKWTNAINIMNRCADGNCNNSTPGCGSGCSDKNICSMGCSNISTLQLEKIN